MRYALLFSALFSLLLAGCGREEQPPPPKLFEDQRHALDKSKGVEDQILQQADQQRRDIDQQTE